MASTEHLLAALGSALREVRLERGLTQEALHLETGVHRNYIGEIERGKRNPTVRRVNILANALDVSVEELFVRAAEHPE